jgi:hypothetical protein
MEAKRAGAYTQGMERHTPWFQVVAVVLVVVGLLTLAAPTPAPAMDPQLMLAMASAAGAIALLVGYLIVANGRDKQRAASLEGIYTCSEREVSGPMGCGGPGSGKPARAAYAPSAAPESPMASEAGTSAAYTPSAAPESPMASEEGAATRPTAIAGLASCPPSQATGPMGCDAPAASRPSLSVGSGFSSAGPAPAALPPAVQGQ